MEPEAKINSRQPAETCDNEQTPLVNSVSESKPPPNQTLPLVFAHSDLLQSIVKDACFSLIDGIHSIVRKYIFCQNVNLVARGLRISVFRLLEFLGGHG
jgi:hypothetical protein